MASVHGCIGCGSSAIGRLVRVGLRLGLGPRVGVRSGCLALASLASPSPDQVGDDVST